VLRKLTHFGLMSGSHNKLLYGNNFNHWNFSDWVVDINYFSLSNPNPSHLPKHESLSRNHDFLSVFDIVEYYSRWSCSCFEHLPLQSPPLRPLYQNQVSREKCRIFRKCSYKLWEKRSARSICNFVFFKNLTHFYPFVVVWMVLRLIECISA